MTKIKNDFIPFCPIPVSEYSHVLLAHGGGGKLMHHLIEKMFKACFVSSSANDHDSVVLDCPKKRIAFTTDSYVVRPLFFPGGDIGKLAVNGTVNDLAMAGARPAYLSCGFILEEGLAMESLWRVVQSMQEAARQAGVEIVTGDTKVVDKGKGDGIFINTAGIGIMDHDVEIAPRKVQPGDAVLLNGDIARHGMAIMAVREGLAFESAIASDTAPLAEMVLSLLKEGVDVHCLRDCTRGGLATTLNEIASVAGVGIHIEEAVIPVRGDVASACELLGLDPLYVANEGRFVAFVAGKDGKRAVEIMRRYPQGLGAVVIGEAAASGKAAVTMKNRIGSSRIVDMLSGEQLPRIC